MVAASGGNDCRFLNLIAHEEWKERRRKLQGNQQRQSSKKRRKRKGNEEGREKAHCPSRLPLNPSVHRHLVLSCSRIVASRPPQ